MFRQIASLAFVLTSLVAWGPTAAWAQSSGSPTTLSDRLEQFRDDLASDSSPPPQKKKPAAANSAAPTPPDAHGPPAPGSAGKRGPGGPSSRRTAQPSYKPQQHPELPPDVEANPAKQPTIATEKAPAMLEAEEESEPDASAMPIPKMARGSSPHKAPVRRVEPEQTTEPDPLPSQAETIRRPERSDRSEHSERSERPERSTAMPAGKDVLLSGRTAALAIEAHGPRKVIIGREAVFKIALQNTSEVAANEVAVAIDIPPAAEIVDVQTTGGSSQAGASADGPAPLVWQIPRVGPHSHETMTIKLIPRQNTPIELAFRWTSQPETSRASVEVQEPKLAMSLSGPEEVLYGQSRAYRLTISNPGTGDAENVTVSLTPIGHSNEPPASHRLGLLPAGGHKTVEVELTARQAGELMIRAHAQAEGGLATEVAQAVLVRRANLNLEVEGPRMKYSGTKGVFRMHVINSGNAVAENVRVAAALPSQAMFQSANSGGRLDPDKGKVVWTVGSLQPGEDRLLELQCLLQAPGENRLAVESSASQDLLASAGALTMVESLADLKLEVHDPTGPIATGDEAVYEVVVRNRGTKMAESIGLMLFFSEGLEATAVHGGPHEIAPGQVVLKTIPSLAPGAEKVYKVHARADRPGNHVFRAEVVCAPLEVKLTCEQSTRFYGDDAGDGGSPAMISRRPGTLPGGTEHQ